MKKITMFYLETCPFCKKSFQAIDELIAENPDYGKIEIEKIEENENGEKIVTMKESTNNLLCG